MAIGSSGERIPDEAAYEEFVRYLLRRASVSDEDPGRSAPFSCGMKDGLDVARDHPPLAGRHALRPRGAPRGTEVHERRHRLDQQHRAVTGPVAPRCDRARRLERSRLPARRQLLARGAASRRVVHAWPERGHAPPSGVVGADAGLAHLSRSSPRGARRFGAPSSRACCRWRGHPEDNLYSWFETMCRFCAGKPLVCYSRYVPGARAFSTSPA